MQALPAPRPSQRRDRARALVGLLDDDSASVRGAVRAELERLGRAARPALERAVRGGSPGLRGRARQLLLERERTRAVRRLVRYAARATHDLETALLLLDRHHSPGADLRAYPMVLDALAEQVRKRIARRPPSLARALTLVEYLGSEVGFRGATHDFHHPDNVHLFRALERRSGMPLTLCAIYAFVARRVNVRTELLPFPGHVLLRVSEAGGEAIVDPFGGGRILTEQQCVTYLADHGLAFRSEWMRGASDTVIFLRHVQNLIHTCRLGGRHAQARELQSVRRVLRRHVSAPSVESPAS